MYSNFNCNPILGRISPPSEPHVPHTNFPLLSFNSSHKDRNSYKGVSWPLKLTLHNSTIVDRSCAAQVLNTIENDYQVYQTKGHKKRRRIEQSNFRYPEL